jgi:DNA-binding CsgD family transcriptional regulator
LRAAQQAIDLAGRCRLVYEGALARLTYAEVGLSLRPNDEIFPAVLNEALAVLKDLGATPALQRAERLLEPPARREGPLTTRELDIVELVALGRTDAEIAERLFISRRTVNTHLSNIYGKTGINNRVELSTWAIANGYVNPPTL